MSPHTWVFKMGRSEITVPIRSRLAVSTAEAAVDASIRGVGLTRVLSYQVDDAMRAGALTAVLQRFGPPPIPVSLVYAAQRLVPLKLRAFLDFVSPRLRARLGVRP
jgi:DNA-binding transcriptional LysR family regulator